MLTCIACSKQLNGGSLSTQQQREEDDDAVVATPSKKQPIKTLTTQVSCYFYNVWIRKMEKYPFKLVNGKLLISLIGNL